MKKPMELTITTIEPSRDFELEYQKAVLLTLYRDGMLDQSQYEECVRRLEKLIK